MGKEDIVNIILFGSFLILLIGCAVIFFVILYQRKKQSDILQRQETASRFQKELLSTQIEIQEQTLKTISQEIHDNVGQVLSLAKLNLGTFVTANNEQEQKINDTKHLVSKAIIDLRNLSRSMYGDQLQELGLKDAIANELAIVQSAGQYLTALDSIGVPYKMEPQKEMVLFRMVQEAINNIIKHAKATEIKLLLDYQPGFFALSIADNGKGFDTNALDASKNGMGLKSMRNRAALIGGTCTIESTNGNGTTINIGLSISNNKI